MRFCRARAHLLAQDARMPPYSVIILARLPRHFSRRRRQPLPLYLIFVARLRVSSARP